MFGQPGFLVMKSAMAEKLCFVPWRDISIQISIFAGSPSLRVDAVRWALIQFPLVADLTADENVVASVWERGWDTVAPSGCGSQKPANIAVYMLILVIELIQQYPRPRLLPRLRL
jgi:hypothetical protein